ncbi:MAG: thiol-disulfide oxidoreductase DCC family protein [Roseiflexaceae bacterium]
MSIIVMFDGVCNLCNGVVRWIIPRDPTNQVRFAALQSAVGQRLLQQHTLDTTALDSVIVLDGDTVFVESDAALRICQALRWPWPLLYYLRIIPRRWRDTIYRWIARNRYRWFGRREQCMLPSPEHAQRFVED